MPSWLQRPGKHKTKLAPFYVTGGYAVRNDWLTPEAQWGFRTWVILALLSLLPIALTIALFTVGTN